MVLNEREICVSQSTIAEVGRNEVNEIQVEGVYQTKVYQTEVCHEVIPDCVGEVRNESEVCLETNLVEEERAVNDFNSTGGEVGEYGVIMAKGVPDCSDCIVYQPEVHQTEVHPEVIPDCDVRNKSEANQETTLVEEVIIVGVLNSRNEMKGENGVKMV